MSCRWKINYILPILPGFLARYPAIRVDWHFDSRQVDLTAEKFHAAIGGGLDLASSMIARTLAPAHIVAVAAPGYRGSEADHTPECPRIARRDLFPLHHDRTDPALHDA